MALRLEVVSICERCERSIYCKDLQPIKDDKLCEEFAPTPASNFSLYGAEMPREAFQLAMAG